MARPGSDHDWVKSSFMLPSHAADLMNERHSKYSSAHHKFTDTTLGGNFAINPPPQFTSSADLKIAGINAASQGMGRKYSEMIDDNSQLIHMRFGVPQFNSLTNFLTGFYNASAATLSRTGRAPGFFYNLGQAAGFVVTLPLAPLILAGKIYRFIAKKPASKFYYLKPTMVLYWNAVNAISNGIAVNMGIIPRVFTKEKNQRVANKLKDGNDKDIQDVYNDGDIVDDGPEYTSADIKKFHDVLPDIYHEGGGIDIYAVANRAQRLSDQYRKSAAKSAENAGSVEELYNSMVQHTEEKIQLEKPAMGGNIASNSSPGFATYLSEWSNQTLSHVLGKGEGTESGDDNKKGWVTSFLEFAEAEIHDGGQFATFRVNHTGEVAETFTNSAGESTLASKMNGTSSSARSRNFSFAGGNLADIPGLGAIMGAVKDTVNGLTDSIGISGIGGIALGNAFVDIPQEWKNSSVDLPKSTYTMNLRTPYGNKMSRFTNLWIPMSMILAGALPKSAGKHAYDAPFLVEIYDKGRQQVRLGIIDSLSITRGVGNLGWTKDQEALGLDITFTVLDLSSMLHMPINPSPGLFDEDSAYSDYLAVLGSLSLSDQLYVGSKFRLNLTRKMASYRQWTSPAKYGMLASDSLPGQVIAAFAREGSR